MFVGRLTIDETSGSGGRNRIKRIRPAAVEIAVKVGSECQQQGGDGDGALVAYEPKYADGSGRGEPDGISGGDLSAIQQSRKIIQDPGATSQGDTGRLMSACRTVQLQSHDERTGIGIL